MNLKNNWRMKIKVLIVSILLPIGVTLSLYLWYRLQSKEKIESQIKLSTLDQVNFNDQTQIQLNHLLDDKSKQELIKQNLKIKDLKVETIEKIHYPYEGKVKWIYKIFQTKNTQKSYFKNFNNGIKFTTTILNKTKYETFLDQKLKKWDFHILSENILNIFKKKYWGSIKTSDFNLNNFAFKNVFDNSKIKASFLNEIVFDHEINSWTTFKENVVFFDIKNLELIKNTFQLKCDIIFWAQNEQKTNIPIKKTKIFEIKSLIRTETLKGVFNSRKEFQVAINKILNLEKSKKYIDLNGITFNDDVRLNFDDFSRIKWKGVNNLTAINTPFKNDISSKSLLYNWVGGLDMSMVTKWPDGFNKRFHLRGYDNHTKIGNNLFVGDLSDKKYIFDQIDPNLQKSNQISARKVTKWFSKQKKDHQFTINGRLFYDLEKNNPFRGDLSKIKLYSSVLANIDLSNVSKKPISYFNVDFTNSLFAEKTMLAGTISSSRIKITGMNLENMIAFDNCEITGNQVINMPDNLITSLGVPTLFDFKTDVDHYDFEGLASDVDYLGTKAKIVESKKDFEAIFDRFVNTINIGSYQNWDVSKIDYKKLQVMNGWMDFSNIVGYQKLGYSTITEWVKAKILPPLLLKNPLNYRNSYSYHNFMDQKYKIEKLLLLTIRWFENGQYHYLYELFPEKKASYGILNNTYTSFELLKKEVISKNFNSFQNGVIDLQNFFIGDDFKITFDDFSRIKWQNTWNLTLKNTPFKGDMSHKNLQNMDFYMIPHRITHLPNDLSHAQLITKQWLNANNVNLQNIFFQGDLSNKKFIGMDLFHIDVSKVTNWPNDLSYVNWENVFNISNNTPFKGDLRNKNLAHSNLKNIDVSQVVYWPDNQKIEKINWKGVKCTLSSKPWTWNSNIWNLIKNQN